MEGSPGSATARYGLAPAPQGLFVVQELLNSGLPSDLDHDPLRSIESATAWIEETAATWAARAEQDRPDLTIAERDLPRLRRTRDAVRGWLAGGAGTRASGAPVTVHLEPGLEVSYGPTSNGIDAVESIVAVELLLASRLDRLRRLKVCANPDCGAAFYDGSPNSTRRWHDVKTCGNIANLRASRARRSNATGGGSEHDPRGA